MNSDLRSYETNEISFQATYNITKISDKDRFLLWFKTDNPSTKSFVCLWRMTDNSISWFCCMCKLWTWTLIANAVSQNKKSIWWQWRTEGGWVGGGFKPPPRNSEGPPKSCQTQTRLWKLLKIAEFSTPTPQDVRKKGSKILKLPRFAIVLH